MTEAEFHLRARVELSEPSLISVLHRDRTCSLWPTFDRAALLVPEIPLEPIPDSLRLVGVSRADARCTRRAPIAAPKNGALEHIW